MNMQVKLFAHAGESHDSVVETFGHSLSDSSLLLPLIIIVAVLVPIVHYMITKRVNILLILAELLAIGVLGYRFSAWLSIVSLSSGFGLALVLMLNDLSAKNEKSS